VDDVPALSPAESLNLVDKLEDVRRCCLAATQIVRQLKQDEKVAESALQKALGS
jgi:hypothetical protein